MTDAHVIELLGFGLMIGIGLGYGYAMRWATIHIRQKLQEQADRICFEYAQDRELMAECLRAAGVLPFNRVDAGTSVNPSDAKT